MTEKAMQNRTTILSLENAIYNMDCIEGMRLAESNTVDLVLTDPPFAIDFEAQRTNYNRKGSRVLEGYNEIQPEDYLEFSRAWIREAARLLKPSGSMFIFSGYNNLKDILIAVDEASLTTVNHIIWKYQFGVVTRRKFVTSHYHVLYVCKNDKLRKFFPYSRFGKDDTKQNGGSLRYQDMEDVWVIPREYWTGSIKTPTKLPAEIIRKILSYTTEPGDLVLDPFLGSGQTAVVSKMEGRRYAGFEIVEEYFKFASERINSGRYLIEADEPTTGRPDRAIRAQPILNFD